MSRDVPTSRSSFSSTSSVFDTAGTDWITPAGPPTPSGVPSDTRPKNRRIVSALDTDDASELWLRMVELQERYGCYRSARMQAAVSAESPSDLMRRCSALQDKLVGFGTLTRGVASRACLDLLNDDVADDLPDEAWLTLGGFVVEV